MDDPRLLDRRFLAGVKLLERTGARTFRVGFSDDGDPTVWYAVCEWGIDPTTGKPMPKGGRVRAETAAAMDPVLAVMRLCAQVLDGGHCTHCGQMTSFVPDTDTALLDQFTCVYAWDPELETFRRQCEGDEL